MKYFAILASVAALSVQANNVDVKHLQGLEIKPIKNIKKLQNTVTINGTKYLKKVVKEDKNVAHARSITLPDVISGEVLYGEGGFNEYLVTGEIIVKLSSDVDFNHFNNTHDLSIKQAYESFYILKSNSGNDLLSIVKQLKAMPEVLSATIDLVDRSVDHF